MSRTETEFGAPASSASAGWHELWRKDDWWAIWLGLGLVLAGYLLFVNSFQLAMDRCDAGEMGQRGAAPRAFPG
jgi:hypothetical protein